ncbi:hypothetical protein YTPLAS21_19370 [Candidatus Nitrosocosmicus sp.]|nr:hypothetical protein YTPLAS21_19370 [Candidatus Nitrosocosmicus sp.]
MIEERRAIKINQNEDYIFFIDMKAGVFQLDKDFGSDMASLSIEDTQALIAFLQTGLDEL